MMNEEIVNLVGQFRNLSHQLIQSTKVTEKMIEQRVALGFLNWCKNSEHDLVLLSRDVDRNRGVELHSSVDLQYLLIVMTRLVNSSLRGSNQRLWFRLSLEVDHGVVLAIRKIALLNICLGIKSCLKFRKRRSASFVGKYTKRYLRRFEKLNETSRTRVEIGKGKELSSTDETIDTDVEEAQPGLRTGVLCVMTTDFLFIRDSDAEASLKQSEIFNCMKSDRVEDGHADPPLNTGVRGIEKFQRINEGDIRHSIVWMVAWDSDNLWFRMGAAFNCVSKAYGPQKESYPFCLGYSNDFESRSEKVHGMPIVWSPPVDSTSDIVHHRRGESQLHYELMGLMGDVHSRREEFCQRGFRFYGCRDSMSRGTMWLQTIRKESWVGTSWSWWGDGAGGGDLQMWGSGTVRWEDIPASIEGRNVYVEVQSVS